VTRKTKRRQIHYGYFFVAYVDVLGQREKLMRLTELPHTSESQDQVVKILKETAGHVSRVRDAFAEYFHAGSRLQRPPSSMEPGVRKQFERLFTGRKFSLTGFSDSFVIAVPLLERDFGPAQAATSVLSSLLGLASMSLGGMAEGIPLRAGLDVERATDVFRDEAYGPVLYRAYELESSVAKYPRAVMGDGFLRYLTELRGATYRPRNVYDVIGSRTAETCAQLIHVDADDGRSMLHILAPFIQGLFRLVAPGLAGRSYEWAVGERDRFAVAGDIKLEERYSRLVRYFEAHGFPDAGSLVSGASKL
jgi:hypothetical protein